MRQLTNDETSFPRVQKKIPKKMKILRRCRYAQCTSFSFSQGFGFPPLFMYKSIERCSRRMGRDETNCSVSI